MARRAREVSSDVQPVSRRSESWYKIAIDNKKVVENPARAVKLHK